MISRELHFRILLIILIVQNYSTKYIYIFIRSMLYWLWKIIEFMKNINGIPELD